MPTMRFILNMNDGTVKILYTDSEVELLQGQYKNIKKEIMTEEGWKEVYYYANNRKERKWFL